MARRYVSGFSPAVGSATLPQGSLYSGASQGFDLREWGFSSNGAGAKKWWLNRLTSTGTQGAAQTAAKYDNDDIAAACSPRTTHTVAPTLGDRMHKLPTVETSNTGFWMMFRDVGVSCPAGVANGIGLLPTVAANVADVTIVWDEGE